MAVHRPIVSTLLAMVEVVVVVVTELAVPEMDAMIINSDDPTSEQVVQSFTAAQRAEIRAMQQSPRLYEQMVASIAPNTCFFCCNIITRDFPRHVQRYDKFGAIPRKKDNFHDRTIQSTTGAITTTSPKYRRFPHPSI